jgi:hypothetical protein
METMPMMSGQDSRPAWDSYSAADNGESAAGGVGGSGGGAGSLEMFGDPLHSSYVT